jgi:hypothetical protein
MSNVMVTQTSTPFTIAWEPLKLTHYGSMGLREPLSAAEGLREP